MFKSQLLKAGVKKRGFIPSPKRRKSLVRGFTLVEVLVAITLGALILGGLYGIFLVSLKSYRRGMAQAELTQNARIVLERITRDLRQTERIITDLPPNDSDPLNPPSSYIQFQDGHEISQIQYIKYLLDSTNLKRQIIYYCFTCPDPPNPSTWVAWDAQDQFGTLPHERIYEDIIKADKITSLKFYGEKLITIEIVSSDGNFSFSFKTQSLGRNIQ